MANDVLEHTRAQELFAQTTGIDVAKQAALRRPPSPLRPQKPQEIYDGAVHDLVEAKRRAIIGEVDHARAGAADPAHQQQQRGRPPSGGRRGMADEPAPPLRSFAKDGPQAPRRQPPSQQQPPREASHGEAPTGERAEPPPAVHRLRRRVHPQAPQPDSGGGAEAEHPRRTTSAPMSPKAPAGEAGPTPVPPPKPARSPSAGPVRQRHLQVGPRPPGAPPPPAGAARDPFRRSRIVRLSQSQQGLEEGGAAAPPPAEPPVGAAATSEGGPEASEEPRPPAGPPPLARPTISFTDSAAPSPKASPASRPAQLLVDAVRSKDESRLAQALTNLRGGQDSGPVLGINDLHPITARTALYEAVALGRLGSVRKLLEAGADPEVAHATQGTPLLYAAAWGEAEIVQALLSAGAKLDSRDCAAFTALHYAAVGGHAGTALVLLEAGADPEAANADGHRPFDIALTGQVAAILANRGLPVGHGSSKKALPVQPSFGIPEEWQQTPHPPAPPATGKGPRASSARSRPGSGRRLVSAGGKQQRPAEDGTGAEPMSSNGSLTASLGSSDDLSPPPKLRLPPKDGRRSQEAQEEQDAPPLPRCASPTASAESPFTAARGEPGDAHRDGTQHAAPDQGGTPRVGLQRVLGGNPADGSPSRFRPGSGGSGSTAQIWLTRRPGSGPSSAGAYFRRIGSPVAQDMAQRTATGLGINAGGLQYQAAMMFHQSVEVKTGDILWTQGELLGEGAYGKVYAGLNQMTGELMAVKVLPLDISNGISAEDQRQHLASLEHELSLYRRFQHKHIVGYIAAHMDFKASTMYIFLEYVPGGSIAHMLERFSAFSEELTRNFTRQLLLGLEYLHGCKVIHRDLKGGNVLVTRDGRVKLADFGASKAYHEATITDGMKSIRGSVFWMAPEVIKGTGYGRRADIWSVGCTVIEMLSGKHPWPQLADNHWTAMFQIARTQTGPPIPEHISPVAKDFLSLCFQIDPQYRPTASELLHHPFVSHIPNAFREAEEARDLNHSL